MPKPVALSITPLSLETDSRTLRSASSLARLGFASRIIEGQLSSGDPARDLPVEVVRFKNSIASQAPHPTSVVQPGAVGSLISAIRQGKLGTPGHLALYAAYRMHFARRFGGINLRGDEKLLYLHSYEYHSGLAQQARANGARIIYDAHDFYQGISSKRDRTPFDENLLLPFLRKLESACISNADEIVTVSRGTADLIEREYGRRPVVLRNGHDPRLDTTPRADLRAKLGLTSKDILIVAVGNYKAGMAVESVTEALSLLPSNVHVALVGRGYSSVSIPNALKGRLHLGNAVLPREVVSFIGSADIGLVIYKPISQNYLHALPNGFFQAVASGLPLIYPALPEIEAAVRGHDVGFKMQDVTGQAIRMGFNEVMARYDEHAHEVKRLAQEVSWVSDEKTLAEIVGRLCPDISMSRD